MPLQEINDCEDARTAVQTYESGEDKRPEVKRYIIRRCIELGCTEHIPDKWEVEARNDG